MAGTLYCDPESHPGYRGISSIFQYTNQDGVRARVNCGQAAALTLLTHYRKLSPDPLHARQIMARVEEHYPPDNLGGCLGTSRRRVTRICRAYGLTLAAIEGEEQLRGLLAQRRPVLVMCGVSSGRVLDLFNIPGGHWMVAYGFDVDFVYLTNYGRMLWSEFRKGWSSFVARLINMRQTGLAVQQQKTPEAASGVDAWCRMIALRLHTHSLPPQPAETSQC